MKVIRTPPAPPKPEQKPEVLEVKPPPPTVVQPIVNNDEVAAALRENNQTTTKQLDQLKDILEKLPVKTEGRRPDSWCIKCNRDSDGYIETIDLEPVYNPLN